jgi:SNF2 family DNA or RNA helicase
MSASLDEQLEACPKLTKTLDILKRIRERAEKVLIFTRFRSVQSVLQNAIVETFGVFPECINGSVHGNRQAVVDHFSEKEGFAVLILSPDVAGIGLNVTAANHVIHYTRPWNPAKEEQATSRAHRIGQEKTVEVYLPITKDERFVTIEQMLDELLQEKQKLARDVLFPFLGLEITNKELLDRVKDSDVPTED